MPRFRSLWRTTPGLAFCAVLAAALVVLIGLDVGQRVAVRSQLQAVAENAALAGVKALQDSAGQDETQRREMAVAASRAVTEKAGSIDAAITTSVAPIAVSVALPDASGWLGRINGTVAVVGKAGYLAPRQSSDGSQGRLYNRLDWNIVTARSRPSAPVF